MMAITSFLCERDPFSGDASLRNTATGVVAHSAVNVDNAKQVGLQILQAMEGQTVSEVTLKKKDHAVTMSAKSSVRIDGCPVQIDAQFLFQRLVAAANNKYENKKEVFWYELRSFPSSLFETTGLLLHHNKAPLADELWEIIDTSGCDRSVFFLDDGTFLQRNVEPLSRNIVLSYVRHIKDRYPNAVIVFDG